MPKYTMCFVPFAWGSSSEVLDYERHVINCFQAPMQDRVKHGSFRVARNRAWKRFRQKLSIDDELKLNQCHILRGYADRYEGITGFGTCVRHFSQLCDWLNKN